MRWFAAALLGLGACTSGPATITITSPTGIGQLVPGGAIDIGWTVAGTFDPAALHLAVQLRPDGRIDTIYDPAAPLGRPTATGYHWTGQLSNPTLVVQEGPGYFDIIIDDGGVAADAGDSHVIVVQGLRFTQPIGSTPLPVSMAAPIDLDFDTSTVSTLSVDLTATSTTQGTGAIALENVSVPGELRTVARTVSWNGTDATGAPLPSGTYQISAHVLDTGSAASYVVDGGLVQVP